MKEISEQLLTVREVAGILRIDESTVYKWVDESRLSYLDFGTDKKRCLRFKQKDIVNFIDENDNGKEDNESNKLEGSGYRPAERR